jgi:integrase
VRFIRKEGKFYKYYWWEKSEADQKGKLRKTSLRTGDKRLAETIQRDLDNKQAADKFNIKFYNGTGIRLAEFSQEMIRYSWTNKSPATAIRETRVFSKFLKFCGDYPLHKITPGLIEKYKTSVKGVLSPNTINLHLRHLRAAFTHAVHFGYIEKNPFIGIRKIKTPDLLPRFMTRDQVEKLFKKMETLERGDRASIYSHVMVAIYTGARAEEIVKLKWRDVYLDQEKIKLYGKGQKERIVPLPATLFQYLLRLHQEELDREPKGDILDRYVCQGTRKPDQLSHRFKHYARKGKVKGQLDPELKDFKLHDCRHTYASWLAQACVSLQIIRELLGHTSIKTTLIYAHLVPSNLSDAVQVLDLDPGTYQLYTGQAKSKKTKITNLKFYQK